MQAVHTIQEHNAPNLEARNLQKQFGATFKAEAEYLRNI